MIHQIRARRFLFFPSRRRHTRYPLVTGVQTCALPIWIPFDVSVSFAPRRTHAAGPRAEHRSEEHTSELQSRVDISYAVFCLNNTSKDDKQGPVTLNFSAPVTSNCTTGL